MTDVPVSSVGVSPRQLAQSPYASGECSSYLSIFAIQFADIPLRRALDVWNARGILGLLFALCVTGFWMLPVALDAAVLHPAVAFFKVLSILIAGLLYRASWNGADMVSHAFFALSAIGMMLSVGLLYQDAPQQLCSTYRIDEQSDAGRAIMAWAIVGLAIWLGSVGLMSLDAES